MDGSLLKEIDYLTRLIKQHKQKICQRPIKSKYTFHNTCTGKACTNPTNNSEKDIINCRQYEHSVPKVGTNLESTVKAANIHVNPNFKGQKPVIHVNPKMQKPPQIHLNPKVQSKPLIHINPRIMRTVPQDCQKEGNQVLLKAESSKSETNLCDTKRSVYVNPELMKKLSSSAKAEVTKGKTQPASRSATSSKTEIAKTILETKSPVKRPHNSSIIVLSRQKLVRVGRTCKDSAAVATASPIKVKRLAQTRLASPYKKVWLRSKNISTKNTKVFKSSKLNKYKIDRTVLETSREKKTTDSSTSNKMELVTIGGVVYKSTRNQLIRRSLSLKRKRAANSNSDKFFVTANGKKLRRLKLSKDNRSATNIGVQRTAISLFKSLPVPSPKVSQKTIISNKVKQRSIQILRNKMRKNNQPCLLYQRFGYCAAHQKGTCPKLHDKKQVSLCKRFLQGKCMLDNCPLSHDVGPEKMPTCKYFLEACCTRDSCPYLHVKVSSNTPICIEFLKGYCAKGNECKRRHENVCPDFARDGKCSRGKYCPYPHKTQASPSRQNDKYFERKTKKARHDKDVPVQSQSSVPHSLENRLRYYEKCENTEEGKSKTIESAEAAETFGNSDDSLNDSDQVEMNESDLIATDAPKRPPLGSLPAYIPID